MSRYSLSEEYSKIYSNKFDTLSYNNLRFLDLMLDEDIEQVMESLYWEFRDYGNSSDEAFSILESSLEDEVLSESLEYICEMNPYASAGSEAARAYNKYVSKNKKTAEQKSKWDSRKARVTGAVRKVKGDVKAGVANLAKSAQSNISSARKSGMAQLTRLVRGARKVGGAVASKTRELASSAREGGRKVAAATRAGAQAFKQELSRKPAPQMKALPAAGQTSASSRRNRVATASRGTQVINTATQPAYRKPGAPVRGLLPSASVGAAQRASEQERSQARRNRVATATAGTSRSSKGSRFAAPGGRLSSQRSRTGRREAAGRFAKKAGVSENFEYLLSIIAEDLVNEGYADTFEDALIIFENLSDSIVESTLQEYADYYLTE